MHPQISSWRDQINDFQHCHLVERNSVKTYNRGSSSSLAWLARHIQVFPSIFGISTFQYLDLDINDIDLSFLFLLSLAFFSGGDGWKVVFTYQPDPIRLRAVGVFLAVFRCDDWILFYFLSNRSLIFSWYAHQHQEKYVKNPLTTRH